MSKKQSKKQQTGKNKKQRDDNIDDFIEQDQHYEGYSGKQEPQQEQPRDKNKKLTDYTATFRPEKSKINQHQKVRVEGLFDSLLGEAVPNSGKMQAEEAEESDDDIELLLKSKLGHPVNKQSTVEDLNQKKKQALEMHENIDEYEQLEMLLKSRSGMAKPPEKITLAKKTVEAFQKEEINLENVNFDIPTALVKRVEDLPQEINLFLTEIYPTYDDRLILFGVLENGERIAIQIQEMDRNIYFVLKSDQLTEAKQEIDRRLRAAGINKFQSEFVKRKYVFEIEGIPRKELTLYKVSYPFSLKSKDVPKPDWQGITYKYVIGTTYTQLELFVVKNKIKGPSWLTVNREFLQNNSKSERVVWSGICPNIYQSNSIQVVDNTQTLKVPELRVLSFSLKYVKPSEVSKKKLFLNVKDPKENIIFAICSHYCKAYDIECKPKKPELQGSIYYLSSLGKPPETKKIRRVACADEDQLLSRFVAEVNALDPDFLVCHDACNALDALISRLEKLKNNQVGKLGRLVKAKQLPRNMNQKIHAVISGRLLIDTFVHAKDMMRSVDYSLANMSKVIPGGRELNTFDRQELKRELEQGRASRIMQYILEESECTFYLMNHLEIVQLTKQLTNICGNIWRRSLENARAQRNEFLIMHECQKEELIIPDKFNKYQFEEQEKDGEQNNQPGKKRKKYMGGLVLDPIKGLHSQYILLLDFNSLYPSIIRQYNVCFSKIDRPTTPLSQFYRTGKKMEIEQEEKEEKEVQTLPKTECVESKWGFLPKLIDRIVKMRNEFKRKMKTAPGDKVLVYDIIQKAYKLVSNSIYGCLGFSNSRFYAPHLAAFITSKGRDALSRAKEIVLRAGVQVIYGDTDSLMLKPVENAQFSEVAKIEELNNIARKLKKDINNEYTKLEIDIDGIFKPLLLIMKKKYVAMKLKNFDEVLVKKVEPVFEIEYKGVDLVKRDGCEVSRRASKAVLNILMQNKGSVEFAVSEIYKYVEELEKYLTTIQPKKDYKEFLLAKTLNKHPSEYKNGSDRMPHIKVARDRINAGEKAQALINHAINYLIVEGAEDGPLADRAFDDKRFLLTQDGPNPMKIDLQHYKAFEILPPMIRLFDSISEINKGFLYETMKIKEKHIRHIERETRDGNQGESGVVATLVINSKELSQPINAIFMSIQCPGDTCHRSYQFVKDGIFSFVCTNEKCNYSKSLLLLPLIYNLIENYLYVKTEEFYRAPYKCHECTKKWAMCRRCCGRFPTKIYSTNEMHATIYNLLRVLNNTQNIATRGIGKAISAHSKREGEQKLGLIRGLLNRTLKESMFENMQVDFMSRLKI